MRNAFVTALLLATVALSSSNILPILSMGSRQQYGQSNDNTKTFSKHQTRDELTDVLFLYENDKPTDSQELYREPFNAVKNAGYSTAKDEIYDMTGFRKEQWHNYPRQLDRLNKYFYENSKADKRNLDPDEPSEADDYSNIKESSNDISNENLNDNFDFLKSIDEVDKAAAIMNPLIVLKIHLACLNKGKEFDKVPDRTSELEDDYSLNDNVDYIVNDENPKISIMKVKREGREKSETTESEQSEPKNRMVNKRIFSLWSRLQSLNHKGHELHHRRHLYALYGVPDSEAGGGGGGGGGGVLTAETRATFMRPPGSPLRWG